MFANATSSTTIPTTPTGFAYDYFIKDHLGNVRMVITDEVKQDAYPMATMETAQLATEEQYYANISTTKTAKPAGYPTDATTSPNDYVAKVNGSGNKIGPSILLKVMAGDKLTIGVNSWYRKNGAAPGQPADLLNSLVAALAGGVSGAAPTHGTATQLISSGSLDPAALGFIQNRTALSNSNKPKAYLNWVFLDEQLKFNKDNGASGTDEVGEDNQANVKPHGITDIPINKNGYFFVYVSNETPNIDVFFDNLKVLHKRGPLLEETHYYPFGLTMAGISSKSLAFGELGNKKGYNGNELQNKEFGDGSGLEFYDFNARTYDQQIGRFLQIDPMTEEGGQESLTPYQYSYNNPIRYSDPDGKCPNCLIGAIVGAVVDYATQVAANRLEGKSWSESLTKVNTTSILISGVAGGLSGGASLLVPKRAAGKVIGEVVTTAIDAGESVLKQYNDGSQQGKSFSESVSLSQTVSDVATNKVAGKLTENVQVNSNSTIKSTERQLDRAERVAAGDPTSSGRAATVNKLDNRLNTQNKVNQAANQAASNTVSATIQGASSASRGSQQSPQLPRVNYNPTDNTSVRRPIVYPLR